MTQKTVPERHCLPEVKPSRPQSKTSREDWLRIAREVLITEGVGEVKVLILAQNLGVSRSSFYWHFKSHQDLLDTLLAEWEARNTSTIVQHCEAPAENITEALCQFFLCFIDPDLFDQGLDFAVREWSRRDPLVRQRIDAADQARLLAVTRLFSRYGYAPEDADARARIVYYMQLGYHALEVNEPLETRINRLKGYIRGFTGQEPGDLSDFKQQMRALIR